MAYRMSPNTPLLIVKDETGTTINYHYNMRIGGNVRYGPIIPWLNDQQREHFLGLGLVEEIADDAAAADTAAQAQPVASSELPDGVNAELFDDCVKDLDKLGVPSTAGAPSARTALRENGMAYGNDVIAAAVRARKLRPAPETAVD